MSVDVKRQSSGAEQLLSGMNKDQRPTKRLTIPPEKVNVPRNSLITEMLKEHDYKAIQIFVTSVILFEVIKEWLNPVGEDTKSIPSDYTLIIWLGKQALKSFIPNNPKNVANALIFMAGMIAVTTVIPFCSVYVYAAVRRKLMCLTDRKSIKNFILIGFNISCVLLYLSYQLSFIIATSYVIFNLDISAFMSCLAFTEQTRLMMKSHAFIRNWIGKVLNNVGEDELTDESTSNREVQQQHKQTMPKLSKYVYFLWAPTLVYRDAYPRTKAIRWRFFATNFIQSFVGIVCMCNILRYNIVTPFEQYYKHLGRDVHLTTNSTTIEARGEDLSPVEKEWRRMTSTFLANFIPSCLAALATVFLVFYCCLHAWLNAFAEILRFADRQFYTDWWVSQDWGRYYRTWNEIVYDWLHMYVYRDVQILIFKIAGLNYHGEKINSTENEKNSKLIDLLIKKRRMLASGAVFLMSSIWHEWIIVGTLHLFYPLLTVQFLGVGFLLFLLTKEFGIKVGNLQILSALCFGNAINFAGYVMEYNAHRLCAPVYDDWRGKVIPRSWFTCKPI